MLLSVAIALTRFYSGTFTEANALLCGVLACWYVLVLKPSRLFDGSSGRIVGKVLVVLAIVMVCRAAYIVVYWTSLTAWSFDIAARTSDGLDAFMASHPGKTMFLIPDNAHRTLTIDSAIYKGGTDIYDGHWGVSPYVTGLFPDRSYLPGVIGGFERPVDLSEYTKVVFVAGPAPVEDAITPYVGQTRERELALARERLYQVFAVRLDDFDCPYEGFVPNFSLVIGCVRR